MASADNDNDDYVELVVLDWFVRSWSPQKRDKFELGCMNPHLTVHLGDVTCEDKFLLTESTCLRRWRLDESCWHLAWHFHHFMMRQIMSTRFRLYFRHVNILRTWLLCIKLMHGVWKIWPQFRVSFLERQSNNANFYLHLWWLLIRKVFHWSFSAVNTGSSESTSSVSKNASSLTLIFSKFFVQQKQDSIDDALRSMSSLISPPSYNPNFVFINIGPSVSQNFSPSSDSKKTSVLINISTLVLSERTIKGKVL